MTPCPERCWRLALLLLLLPIASFPSLVSSKEDSPEHAQISWVLVEDDGSSCADICRACGGECVESEEAWPRGFSWRCAAEFGVACSEHKYVDQAPERYDLQKEPRCGWQPDAAMEAAAARSCGAVPSAVARRRLGAGGADDAAEDGGDEGEAADGRRFCPCRAAEEGGGGGEEEEEEEQPQQAPAASAPSDKDGHRHADVDAAEASGYSCSFRVDDHFRSVFYHEKDITSLVAGGSAWNATRRVSFVPTPGAYLVVYGEDRNGDFFNKGGFWADCDGAPSSKLAKAWESFCSKDAIDAPHLQGAGWGWSPATFHAGRMWKPGTLGTAGMQYCAFRTRPMKEEGYSCDIKVDDYVRKVYYNGMDITTTVAGDLNRWNALRRVSFPPVPGAYVVIYGEDWKGDFFGKGGFWADCDTVPSSALERSWESYCSSSALSVKYQKGEGWGWKRPTFHRGSHEEESWAPGTLGDKGRGHCVFRMMPFKATHGAAATTTTVVAAAASEAAKEEEKKEVRAAEASTSTRAPPATTTTEEEKRPDPPEMPRGWRAIWDKRHQDYYFWEPATDQTTWSMDKVTATLQEEEKAKEKRLVKEEEKWDRPCQSKEECLKIVDTYLSKQPRQANLLLRTYGPGSLGGGDCGELCELPEPCPTDPILAGCRYDTYDNAMAAIYLTKRGKLGAAKSILDSFARLLYPTSLDGIPHKVRHVGPSGRTLTLLAAAYSDLDGAEAGQYDSNGVYDGAVDTGNNAWAALAFAHYAAAADSPCYAAVARDMLSALVAGKSECGDALGGVVGRREPYPRNYRSTEHNIDVSALARVLGDGKTWKQVNHFVRSMYGRNKAYNRSYSMGTGDEETCDSSQPEGPVPADCTYWNLLADADPDGRRMAAALSFALRTPHPKEPSGSGGKEDDENDPNFQAAQGMWSTDQDLIHHTGHSFHGTRFTTWGNGIQWEVTAAAAMAMLHFTKKYGELKDGGATVDVNHFVRQARESLRLLLGMYRGVPGSVLGGNREAWVKWTMVQDKWRRAVGFPGGTDTGVAWSYLRYNHVASTAWTGLLLLYQADEGNALNEDANPMAPPSRAVPKSTGDLSCLPQEGKPRQQHAHGKAEEVEDKKHEEKKEDQPEEAATTRRATTTTTPPTTARSTTTEAPAPSTTTATTALSEEAEFRLWRAWMRNRSAGDSAGQGEETGAHQRAGGGGGGGGGGRIGEAPGVVAEVKVEHLIGGSLGVDLHAETLTVVGFKNPEAKKVGWRMGDRLVSAGGKVLEGNGDLQHELHKLGSQDKFVKSPITFKVLRLDLCGHSCWEAVHELGKACSSTWAGECPGGKPPMPFSRKSALSDFCPAECGQASIKGAWTHALQPGVEVVLITGGKIHWQSGHQTDLEPEDGTEPPRKFMTRFRGEVFHGELLDNGTLRWSDGDLWLRVAGAQAPQGGPPPLSWSHGPSTGDGAGTDGHHAAAPAPSKAGDDGSAAAAGEATLQRTDWDAWRRRHGGEEGDAEFDEFLDWRSKHELVREGHADGSEETVRLLVDGAAGLLGGFVRSVGGGSGGGRGGGGRGGSGGPEEKFLLGGRHHRRRGDDGGGGGDGDGGTQASTALAQGARAASLGGCLLFALLAGVAWRQARTRTARHAPRDVRASFSLLLHSDSRDIEDDVEME